MLYFWTFLILSILCVSCYTWQAMGTAASISAFLDMATLMALIYVFTMRLTNGNEMVTGLFLFLAPICGLVIRLMVMDDKQQFGMLRSVINHHLELFIIYLNLLKCQRR